MSKRYIFHNSGSVLILALWVLCVLSILAVGLGGTVSQEINVSSYFQNKPKARYLAEAGIKRAQNIIKADENVYDSLNEAWAAALKDVALGEGAYNVTITDEESKININTASPKTLERLFLVTGALQGDDAYVAASSIVDWRDTDIIPLEGGAEDGYYKSLEAPYASKDDRFQVLEEFLWVRVVTGEAFLKVKDHITIYGDGRVNINTAGWGALCALGMSGKLADKIILYRAGRDGIGGTKDDNILQDHAKIAKELIFGAGLDMEDADRLSEITSRNLLSVKSGNFSVDAEGRIGRRAERIICVTDRGNNIEYWRE